MSDLDDLLKRLLIDGRIDAASWLLGTNVVSAEPLTVELPAGERVHADLVFQVQLADGRQGVLHVEIQGRRTQRPMRWRMLDYMCRLAGTYEGFLQSVVLYQEKSAGSSDPGKYRIECPDGSTSIEWRYSVVHLWGMRADDILQLGRRSLLPLVALTQIEHPAATLPRVLEAIREEPNSAQQTQLLAQLMGLVQDEEVTAMLERIFSEEELEELKRFPFRWRAVQQALAEGQVKGQIQQAREDILQVIVVRFNPPATEYLALQAALAAIDDPARLNKLFRQALVVSDVTGLLSELAPPPGAIQPE